MFKLVKWHRPEMINSIWKPSEWFTKEGGETIHIFKNHKFGEIEVSREMYYKCFKYFIEEQNLNENEK